MAKIRFMTDSAADIPQKYIDEYGIMLLRYPIILEDEDREILDGREYTNEEFYDILLKSDKIPSHAQYTIFQMEEFYEQVWREGYDSLIYTCINFKGSATGQNSLAAKENFFAHHPEAEGKFEIYVLDSKNYTYTYGYAVVEAAKRARQEEMTTRQAVDMIQDCLDHAKLLFTSYNLKFARKSGRVSAAAAILGGTMGIRPIMSFPNGDSTVLAKPRGDAKVIEMMTRMMVDEMEPGSPYMVIHGCLPDKNRDMSAACRAAVGYDPAEEYLIGGVIAINAGPELVGCIYRTKYRITGEDDVHRDDAG